MYQSQQELLNQGIAQMKAKEAELVSLYMQAINASAANFFAQLPATSQQTYAVTNIRGIIARLDGVQMSSERVEQNLLGFFEQGLSLADLNEVFDFFESNCNRWLEQQFTTNSPITKILQEKIRYIRQAYSTITSLAMLKFQNNKA